MFNDEKSEENLLIFDSHSEIVDTTLNFRKNDIDLHVNEENIIKRNDIFFLVYSKNQTPEKNEIRKEKKEINKTPNKSELNTKIVLNTSETSNTSIIRFQTNSPVDVIYRKDAYYKHFKVTLGKYIKKKLMD